MNALTKLKEYFFCDEEEQMHASDIAITVGVVSLTVICMATVIFI